MIRPIYRLFASAVLRPITRFTVKYCSFILNRIPGMPIFYLFLPNIHTGCVLTLHVLRKIQVKTGRRIVVISAWPFWPADTARDPFLTSFIRGLTPHFRYIWLPSKVEDLTRKLLNLVARSVHMHRDLYHHVNFQSTVRYTSSSTMLHVDILNQEARVPLEIPKTHESILDAQLQELGVPSNGWFVCAHAREHGWFRELNAYEMKTPSGYRHEQEDHRNVDIEDYFQAFDYIVSMGGTVVRMGDSTMTPVGDIKGVIDYPFSQNRSLAMDLYLVSKCRFVLGCNSGFSCFAEAFSTPLLQTNFTSPANSARFPYSNNLFLFQHLVETASGKQVELNRMFDPNLITINDPFHFAALGYRCKPNSPEEILDATKEMLQLVETDSFDDIRTPGQELFHRMRLQSLETLWSPTSSTGDDAYAPITSSESRISASFAEHYLQGNQNNSLAGTNSPFSNHSKTE